MTDDKWFISGLNSVYPITPRPSRLSAEWRVCLEGEPPDAFPHIKYYHSNTACVIARRSEYNFHRIIMTDYCTAVRVFPLGNNQK